VNKGMKKGRGYNPWPSHVTDARTVKPVVYRFSSNSPLPFGAALMGESSFGALVNSRAPPSSAPLLLQAYDEVVTSRKWQVGRDLPSSRRGR
jgi:hypothetical protein